jgi:arylsulfatase A
MVDDVVRQIVDAVKQAGIQDNTMIIFTSDNGCSPMADFAELEAAGHDPSYIYRGHKADIYEGGHRIPFIVQWPGKIHGRIHFRPNHMPHRSSRDRCRYCGHPYSIPAAGEDSYDLTPLLTDPGISAPIREATVHHSIHGCFALRQGDWKICFCPGSGGWSYPTPKEAAGMNLPPVQLFNLSNGPAEEKNVADTHPDMVRQLSTLMQQYIDEGRSTPGEKELNDREISLVN